MRKLMGARRSDADERQFHSVSEAARIFGVSEMTLYRAIRDGQFPAVRIMGRLIVPARVIDSIVDAAIESYSLVDSADWVPEGSAAASAAQGTGPYRQQRDLEGRPRLGANQTGGGSPMRRATGAVSSIADPEPSDAGAPFARRTAKPRVVDGLP